MADMEQDEEKKKKAKEVAKSRKQPKKDRNIQKAAAPKQEGEDFLGFTVDSDTKQALTYFLPQVIGGLAGGLFEGTAGALAGAEAGQQATEGFQKYRMGEAQIGSEQARQRQLALGPQSAAPFAQTGRELPGVGMTVIDRRTGIEMVTDPVTGQPRPITQEEVDRIAGTQSRFERRQALTEQKAAQLANPQVEALAAMDKVQNQINELKTLSKNVDTGPISGRLQSMAQSVGATSLTRLAGLDPDSFAQLKASAAGTVLNATKMLQGARPSDLDLEYVERIVPSENDDDDVFLAKLELLERFMLENNKSLRQAIKTGQPLKKGTIAEFYKQNASEELKKGSTNRAQSLLDRIRTIRGKQ
jgi:hypothetical protein